MKTKVRITLHVVSKYKTAYLCQGFLMIMLLSPTITFLKIVEALAEFMDRPCINLQRFDFLSYDCKYRVEFVSTLLRSRVSFSLG